MTLRSLPVRLIRHHVAWHLLVGGLGDDGAGGGGGGGGDAPCGLCSVRPQMQFSAEGASGGGCPVWVENKGKTLKPHCRCQPVGTVDFSMGSAAKSTLAQPSTNIPIQCPECGLPVFCELVFMTPMDPILIGLNLFCQMTFIFCTILFFCSRRFNVILLTLQRQHPAILLRVASTMPAVDDVDDVGPSPFERFRTRAKPEKRNGALSTHSLAPLESANTKTTYTQTHTKSTHEA